jgi:Ni/Co efflux regulator RcnB
MSTSFSRLVDANRRAVVLYAQKRFRAPIFSSRAQRGTRHNQPNSDEAILEMQPGKILLSVAALSILAVRFTQSAQAESYTRVCATTVDSESNEVPLADSSVPGAGEKLVVHLDANTECVALIFPLIEKGSRLANGWRPQIVALPQWDERKLPAPPAVWNWNKGADFFELWIFFFKRDAAGLDEIQKLVAAMQNRTLDEKVLTQQTRKLCEKLNPRMTGKQPIIPGAKATAALVGGTVRSTEFPWRDYAQKVVLNEAFEGALVVRHGR